MVVIKRQYGKNVQYVKWSSSKGINNKELLEYKFYQYIYKIPKKSCYKRIIHDGYWNGLNVAVGK